MRVLRVFPCLLLAFLVACDGEQAAAPKVPAPEPKAVSPAPALPAAEPAPERPVVVAPPSPPVPSMQQAPRVEEPSVELRVAPLDLSLPDELLESPPGEAPAAELPDPEPLLPPLFGEKMQAPPPFELGGRLISNESAAEDDDSWHALDGAELELRFRR